MSSTSSSSIVTGRARSCTGCRQVKLACDARKTHPQPCSRCKSKGLQCKFDSNFKRIPMRRVAQDITNGIHRLLPTSPSTTATSPAKSLITEPHSTPALDFTTSVSPPSGQQSLHQSIQSYVETQQWLNLSENDYYRNYVFGSIELDPETTVSLFKHFERYYRPHALFLANIDSLTTLETKSQLLFWTIVLISAREHQKYEGLYEQICVVHGVLLSHITYIAIQTIEEVHSLLLLCLWAIPKHRGQHDPSWNYIGLATNAAMQLNCHNPISLDSITSSWRGTSDQSAKEIPPNISSLTWIYCFEIGARLACYLGVPPTLSSGSMLRSVSKAVSLVSSVLKEEQKATAEILKLSCQSTSEVDYAEDPQTRFSMIQMFDNQLNTVGQSYHSYWTWELDIELLCSKLNLYALIFTISIANSLDRQQAQANRQIILLKAQEAALRLISRVTQLSNTPVDDPLYLAGTLTFYPKHYFTALFMAALFLFRFLASYQGATQHDKETVINGLIDAHRIFQSFPDHRDAWKAAVNVQVLVELIRNEDGPHPYPIDELVITNRLGASVSYDALFRTECHRNRNPNTGATPPVSNWVMISDDPRQRLPMTPQLKAATSGSSQQETDDGQSQSLMGGGPWGVWDNYIQNFEVPIGELEQLNNELLVQMDPTSQTQLYESGSRSTMPIVGHNQYLGS